MHRAKHRAGGRDTADLLATTLIERFTANPDLRSAGVATLPAPRALPPFPRYGDSPLFGAARHAAAGRVRPQPVSATLSVTVLGAAAAVTAAVTPPVAPPLAVETTGSLAPVRDTVPVPAPLAVPAPAAAVVPEQPTVKGADLAVAASGEMQRLTPTVEARIATVANASALTSPAALRKAALTNALSKIGRPYRWGASGPNAFDCSGLVKWSFSNAGKALPRTSRAMAGVGMPVSRANLQPGDLVFFYQPISHVGIYIGNGKIVHASRGGQPVKISDMARMRFTKAVRV
jgi:cell wall-associated NlpC family hydrolase